jgi:hypothetical protein
MQKSAQQPHPIQVLIGLFILAGVLTLSGCDFVPEEPTVTPTLTATQTETPSPTVDWFPATPTPSLQPLPSPTPQPTLEDLRQGVTELLVDDDFTDENMWETRQSTVGNVAFGIQNLTLAIARPNISLTSLSQHELPQDFYLELTLQTSLCQPSDHAGVLFWHQSEGDYYRLLIDCAGRVRLELFQGGQASVLQDWEYAQRVQPGAPAANRLGLWVSDGQFQLYINDAFQFSRTIASNRSGGLGVYARTISGNAMTIKFSDLQIYQVETD